jgi:hypothetical protein
LSVGVLAQRVGRFISPVQRLHRLRVFHLITRKQVIPRDRSISSLVVGLFVGEGDVGHLQSFCLRLIIVGILLWIYDFEYLF